MSKITILHDYPVVLTKDANWFEINKPKMVPGAVIILPQDAVLVMPPEKVEIRTDRTAIQLEPRREPAEKE